MRIHARAWLAAALLCACSPAAALDENTAVELALARQAFRALGEARLAAAEGDVLRAGALPNPELGLERERIASPGGRTEETTIGLAQRFDTSGRRARARGAAEERLRAVRHEQLDARRTLIAQVRATYAQALYEERAGRVRAAWVERLRAGTEIVTKLARAGEVAVYARRRIERELQAALAAELAGSAARDAAREALAAFAGAPALQEPLAGELAPPAPPPLDTLLARLEARPDLAAIDSHAGAQELERAAAARARLPDLTLGAGAKRVEEPGRSDTGIVLSLSIPLPIFERGDGAARIAGARAQELRAERALALARAQADVRAAWSTTTRLTEAAASLRGSSAGELARIAEAAYRAGEGGVVELLDAYRTELESETAALELERRARQARIELDALSGSNDL